MVSEIDILKALHTVQQVCHEASNCPECPLRYYENSCAITKCIPDEWHLKPVPEVKSWRAFVVSEE